MTPGLMAMLAGLFVVPILLLWIGHRLRRRSPRWQHVFRGTLVGHLLAIPVAMLAAMLPPVEWAASDFVRGALGFWSLLVLPAIGALLGSLRGREK